MRRLALPLLVAVSVGTGCGLGENNQNENSAKLALKLQNVDNVMALAGLPASLAPLPVTQTISFTPVSLKFPITLVDVDGEDIDGLNSSAPKV